MRKLFLLISTILSLSGIAQNITVIGIDSLTGLPGEKFVLKPTNVRLPLELVNDSTIGLKASTLDSLRHLYVDTAVNRNGYLLAFDSINHKWYLTAPATGGIGSSTTVQQDSSFLVATANQVGGAIKSGSKGLLLRDTVAALGTGSVYNSPAIAFQAKNTAGGVNTWWRIYTNSNTSSSMYFQSCTGDTSVTANWKQVMLLSNQFGTIPTITGTFSGPISATGYIIPSAASGATAFGGTSTSNATLFDIVKTAAVLLPRFSTTSKNALATGINAGVIYNAGSGGTNGTYANRAVTGGSGTGASISSMTVTGGVVTAVTLSPNGVSGSIGTGYRVGDTISVTGITGLTGFQYVVTSLSADYNSNGALLYDSSASKYNYRSKLHHAWTPVVDSTSISGNLTRSSASALTLTAGRDYIFTGSTATYTLPAVSSSAIGRQNIIYIKNQGSGTITLNSNAGSTLYNTAAQSTINIVAGAACQLLPDGTYFNVMFNN